MKNIIRLTAVLLAFALFPLISQGAVGDLIVKSQKATTSPDIVLPRAATALTGTTPTVSMADEAAAYTLTLSGNTTITFTNAAKVFRSVYLLIGADSVDRTITPSASGGTFYDGNTGAQRTSFTFPSTAIYRLLRVQLFASGKYMIYGIPAIPGPSGDYARGTAETQVAGIHEYTASDTLILTDAGKLVQMNNGSANTLTVPPNSDVAFPVNTVISVYQAGAGQCTITAGSGVTLRARNGAKTGGQYGVATIIKIATDTWVVCGDTAS